MRNKRTISIFSLNVYPASLADAVRIEPVIDFFIKNQFSVIVYTATKPSIEFKYELHKRLNWAIPHNKDKIFTRLLKEVLLGIELGLKLLIAPKSDFYLLTSPPFLTCLIASIGVKIKSGKFIFDIRDLYPDIYVKQKLIKDNGIPHRLLSFFARKVYASADFILTATKGLQNQVKKRTLKPVLLMRNGFNESFKEDIEKFETFTIVFHGNLGRFQNIELLVEIAKHFRDNPKVQFIVIGSGPKENLLMNQSYINFKGRLDNKKTAQIVNKSHLGISLRDDSQISIDAFPVKVYEYIGSGIPSIVTPICEAGELLDELKVGFNLPNKKTEIINKIQLLMDNHVLYKQMKANILHIRQSYSRKILVKEILDQFFNVS